LLSCSQHLLQHQPPLLLLLLLLVLLLVVQRVLGEVLRGVVAAAAQLMWT
jgi:hypothetical protein